jgi:hypothetical protein
VIVALIDSDPDQLDDADPDHAQDFAKEFGNQRSGFSFT